MTIESADGFLTGVLEGFYGRPWSFETRLAYADFLARAGLNTCLYCPKADPYLRKQWQSDWPRSEWLALRTLSRAYRERGIHWGVGLSPFALYLDYGPVQRAQLKRKILRLAQLEAPLLAILFDDMPGDNEALAGRQAEIVADVVAWMPGVRVLVCPTYYSFDPVLERYFGSMPEDYWCQLGAELPLEVDVFWTGNKVCSDTISRADIENICARLGRPVLLWDNYPVNDGAVRSNFLYLEKLSGRDHMPATVLRGHLCNPMNQALLSLPALSGLADLYGGAGSGERWAEGVIGAATWRQLEQDRAAFENLGLSGMGARRCQALAGRYRALPGPAAQEVAQWLSGEFQFDPACLTD